LRPSEATGELAAGTGSPEQLAIDHQSTLAANQRWLDQIEIWFSILQRKLLTPSHFHSLEELTLSIMEFIRCENISPKPIKWTYTVQKLEAKLGTVQ
jgi:hypothetical protein